MKIPLGIRNNNPGNLRAGSKPWVGQSSVDSQGYCQFDTPEAGIRALALDLLIYEDRRKLISLRQFITRWAPPEDNNDTAAYVAAVCRETGASPDAVYELHERGNLIALTKAIIHHENGQQPYSEAQIDSGVDAALRSVDG